MTPRLLNAAAYLRLKKAARALIHACGGVDGAAASTRVGRSVLSDYGNPAKPDSYMPMDVAADLESACGLPIVSRAMAEEAGHLVTAQDFGESTTPSCLSLAGGISKETSDVIVSFTEALADGKITPQERAEIRRQAEEARQVLNNFIAVLDRPLTDEDLEIPSISAGLTKISA